MYKQIASNKRKTWILIIIFLLISILIGWTISETTSYGYGSLIIAVIISTSMALFGFYSGDRVALSSANAKLIEKKDNPYVYRLVENLCITAGLPMPKIYIIPTQSMNAFATGRDPKHASIALTTGIIESLENEELEGVIAHELSHIKNYDIRLATIVIVLVGTIAFISDWGIRARFFGRGRDREEGQMGTVILVASIVLAILSPIIAKIIQLAVSRKREFLADASAALLTRYPDGLASALQKIETNPAPFKQAGTATAHMYIANPFKNNKRKFSKLFSTHPPIEERIKELRKMKDIT